MAVAVPMVVVIVVRSGGVIVSGVLVGSRFRFDRSRLPDRGWSGTGFDLLFERTTDLIPLRVVAVLVGLRIYSWFHVIGKFSVVDCLIELMFVRQFAGARLRVHEEAALGDNAGIGG